MSKASREGIAVAWHHLPGIARGHLTSTSRRRPFGTYAIELATESATIERCQVRIPLRFLAANSFQFAFEQSR